MKKKKLQKIAVVKDKVLKTKYSPLRDELYPEWGGSATQTAEIVEGMNMGDDEETLVVSGELGKGGNPVTIVIIDEVTGQEMELNHVRNALLMLEDERPYSSGWLSLLVGDMRRIADVLGFVAKATVKELKMMFKGYRSGGKTKD